MTELFFDFLYGVLMTALGAGLGWCLVYFRRAAASEEGQATRQQALDALGQLHQLAASVAHDVGQHHSRVQEINQELATTSNDSQAVNEALAKLLKANEEMQNRLASAEEKLQTQAREIETHAQEARTDALTKVANRRAFDDEMARRAAEFSRHGRPVCVLLLDVDHFKKFNDTHGHQAGDEVLKSVAAALKKGVRQTDIVARYGGEEFAVIMPGTDIREAQTGAERARQAIERMKVEFEGKVLRVTASGGVGQLLPGEEIAALVKRADDCLYESKRAGRNCASWHDGTQIFPVPKTDAATTAKANFNRRPAPVPTSVPTTAGDAASEALAALSTRTQFCADVHRRLAEWKRGGAPLSVLLVSIDGYAQIVDSRGAPCGQLTLHLVARFLQAAMRDMDHVARYDTETFGLLLPGATRDDAILVAERLRTAVARCKLSAQGQPLSITVSIGVAEVVDGDDSRRLLERCEEAIDFASQGGENSCYLHNGHEVLRVAAIESK